VCCDLDRYDALSTQFVAENRMHVSIDNETVRLGVQINYNEILWLPLFEPNRNPDYCSRPKHINQASAVSGYGSER